MENILLPKVIIFFQIVFIDIVMAADNAIIIGLIAANFATENRKKIIAWGVAAAFIFRIMFAFGADYMFQFDWLKILGGVFGGLKMTLICSVFILVVETFNGPPSIVPDEKIQASTLYNPVRFLAPAILPTFMSRTQEIHLPELLKPKENNPKP